MKKPHAPIFYVLQMLCLGTLLTACANLYPSRHFTQQMLADAPDIPHMAEVKDVPFIAQEDKYCGPAALAMMSTWLQHPMTQDDAATLVYTPAREGTLQVDMVTAARRIGFLTIENNDPQLAFKQVALGRPMLVFLNLGLAIKPVWHYAILKGYNLDEGTVTLNSGAHENEKMKLDTFLHTWARTDYWSLILSPVDKIPAEVPAVAIQKAILGLEQTELFKDADTAYQAALSVWPKNFAVRMGYANLLYTQKDYKGAEKQFMQVWKDYPQAHAPLNNLTYVLLAQGCYTNAVHAAREALWSAPEKDKPAVQKTVDEALTYLGKPEGRGCARQPTIR